MRSAKLKKTNKTCFRSHMQLLGLQLYKHMYAYICTCVCVCLCVFVSHETKGENEVRERSQGRWD